MVWTMDPDGELAGLIEGGAIAMVTGTCVLALYVEYRVYRRRHGAEHHGKQKPAGRENEFDDGEMDVNPLHDAEALITISISKAAALELQFDQVATSAVEDGASAIRLVDVNRSLQEKHPELCSGLFLRRIAEDSVDGLELAAAQSLLADSSDEADEITLVFSEQQPSLGATVIAAADTVHRLDQMQLSLSLTDLVQSAV
eukprot:COSAG06_NODE_4686_length_4036_cov_7.714757_3_plen_200_part_00